ncbi:MAG: HNH endonuclease [Gaiellales bacterium]|nr:MAG: HNH endonuclease [Gaiellales bacterium]
MNQGEPFFFKLRAPYKAIAGFGFFERFESLPAWLAWECFDEMNGAQDFDSMIDRIVRLRGENGKSVRSGDFKIGCIMISAPIFFEQDEWVEPPADWAPSGIQQGKRYELDSGEGRRVFQDCMQQAQTGSRYWNVETEQPLVADGTSRYGSPIPVRPRLGQGLFSLGVREAYRGACAVTAEHSGPVLDAAHIKPYRLGGEHKIENGLLLRSDIHRLYDRGYVTVTPDHIFRVGDSLRDEFHNGHSYYGLNGSKINLPAAEIQEPSRELLDWHAQFVFKG